MAATGQSELGPRSSAEPAQAAGSPAAGGARVLMWAGQGPALEAHASVNSHPRVATVPQVLATLGLP